MKRFVTIIAAGSILSASLVAGLAASGGEHTAPAASAARTVTPAPTAVAEAPAKGEAGCRDAAWPYRSVCAGQDGAVPRKVRVIATNGPAVPAVR